MENINPPMTTIASGSLDFETRSAPQGNGVRLSAATRAAITIGRSEKRCRLEPPCPTTCLISQHPFLQNQALKPTTNRI